MDRKVSNYMDLVNDDSVEAFKDFIEQNTHPDSKQAIRETEAFKIWQWYCRNLDLPYGVWEVYDKLTTRMGLDKHIDTIRYLRGIAWKADADYMLPGVKNYPDPVSTSELPKRQRETLW